MKERQARRSALLLAPRSCFSSSILSISFSSPVLSLPLSFSLTLCLFPHEVVRSLKGRFTVIKLLTWNSRPGAFTSRIYAPLRAKEGEGRRAGRDEVEETNRNSSRKFVASSDACQGRQPRLLHFLRETTVARECVRKRSLNSRVRMLYNYTYKYRKSIGHHPSRNFGFTLTLQVLSNLNG